MTIEFVDRSTVELIKANASDMDVAMAAWVSNFDKENLPVEIPSKRDIKNYNEYINSDIARYREQADEWYPEVKAYNDRISGLINFLYRERHMSPFEHGSFTFYIDTPIFVAREFMRHRTWSYNETSGRYKELAPRFYLISDERPVQQQGSIGKYSFGEGTAEQYGQILANTTISYTQAWTAYQNMLKAGVAKEVARNVLPVGTMTSFYATANPRNVMQFLLLRNDGPALYEIRKVAEVIEQEFAKAMPLTYAAYKKYDWRDEKVELEDLRKKVAQMEAEETYRSNIEVSRKGGMVTPYEIKTGHRAVL